MTHTPGPWKVGGELIYNGKLEIASVWGFWDKRRRSPIQAEADANARLIAAAPELLEALQGILANAPAPKDIRKDFSYILHLEAARTAIAKATGS